VEKILRLLIFLDSVEVFLQIAVGVWETVSEKLLVVIMFESVRESKGEVASAESALIPLVVIGVVIDGLSDPVPADAFALFYLVAETQDFHSVVVQ
jgi:hypothetical protein